jgi:hypothetical protein
VSPARLTRFFTKEPGGYRVNKEIRAMVIFAPQNLIMDPPFTKLDILCCRNLLIYLTPELQKKLFPLFHYSLNPGGVLFLGSAESIGASPVCSRRWRSRSGFFNGTNPSCRATSSISPPCLCRLRRTGRTSPLAPRRPAPSLQSLADQLLQARFAPPAVLVNDQGDILYISGRTGKYLEPAAGKANWNILAMAREGLRYDLASALQKVHRKKGTVTVRASKSGATPTRGPWTSWCRPSKNPRSCSGWC